MIPLKRKHDGKEDYTLNIPDEVIEKKKTYRKSGQSEEIAFLDMHNKTVAEMRFDLRKSRTRNLTAIPMTKIHRLNQAV